MCNHLASTLETMLLLDKKFRSHLESYSVPAGRIYRAFAVSHLIIFCRAICYYSSASALKGICMWVHKYSERVVEAFMGCLGYSSAKEFGYSRTQWVIGSSQVLRRLVTQELKVVLVHILKSVWETHVLRGLFPQVHERCLRRLEYSGVSEIFKNILLKNSRVWLLMYWRVYGILKYSWVWLHKYSGVFLVTQVLKGVLVTRVLMGCFGHLSTQGVFLVTQQLSRGGWLVRIFRQCLCFLETQPKSVKWANWINSSKRSDWKFINHSFINLLWTHQYEFQWVLKHDAKNTPLIHE